MAPKRPGKSPNKMALGKFGVSLSNRRRALALVRDLQRTRRNPTESDIEVLSAGLPTHQIAQMNTMNMRRIMNIMEEVESQSGGKKQAD